VVNLTIVPADLSFTGTNLKGASRTTLKAVVRNSGNTKATNVKVKFFINEVQVYEKNVSSISKNSKTTVTYSYQIPSTVTSALTFKVTVDSDKTAEITIPVIASNHNLILESLKTTSSNPKPGQKITWVIKVKNAGNVKAEKVKIALFADKDSQNPTSTLIISSINSGASTSKNISWTVPLNLDPAINYPIRATVDPDNTLPESNETDNAQNYALSLKVPDLSIERGEFFTDSSPLYANSFQQIQIKVKNDNVVSVSNAKVGVYYSLNSQTGPRTKLVETSMTLAKKATVSYMFDRVALPSNIQLGTKIYFFIVVDADKLIPESNENNNELIMNRTLIERPPQAQYPYLYLTVRDENDNQKGGVTVNFTDFNQSSNSQTKITGSDPLAQNSPGSVIFDNLPNIGKYTIVVTAPGYRSQTIIHNFDKNNEDSRYPTVNLDKKAALTGTVKNQSGTPPQRCSGGY